MLTVMSIDINTIVVDVHMQSTSQASAYMMNRSSVHLPQSLHTPFTV
jgi:hypothetical protein